jgi:hypothetical protein
MGEKVRIHASCSLFIALKSAGQGVGEKERIHAYSCSLFIARKSAGQGVGEKVRIHASLCSLSARDCNLYMALKSAGKGIGEKVRIHAYSCSLFIALKSAGHGENLCFHPPQSSAFLIRDRKKSGFGIQDKHPVSYFRELSDSLLG